MTLANLDKKLKTMFDILVTARKAEPLTSMTSILKANHISDTTFGKYKLLWAYQFANRSSFKAYIASFNTVSEIISPKNRNTLIDRISTQWDQEKEGIQDFFLVLSEKWIKS